jgi:hypothetical protein
MITKKQYEQARKQLEKAQSESINAMRSGNQDKLDAENERAVKALAIIAEYKNQ